MEEWEDSTEEWEDSTEEWEDSTEEWEDSTEEWEEDSTEEWGDFAAEVSSALDIMADSFTAGLGDIGASILEIGLSLGLAIPTGLTTEQVGGIRTMATATILIQFIHTQTLMLTLITAPSMCTAEPTKPLVHKQMENRCI